MAITDTSYTREYAYYFRGKNLVIVERDYSNSQTLTYGQFKSPNEGVEDGLQLEYVYKPFGVLEDPTRFHLITDISSMTSAQQFNAQGNGDLSSLLEIQLNGLHGNVSTDAFYPMGSFCYIWNGSWNSGLYQVRDKSWDTLNSKIMMTKVADLFLPLEQGDIGQSSVSSLEVFPMYVFYDVKRLGDPNTDLPYDDYLNTALVYYVKARLAEDMGNIEGKEYFMREFKKRISINENSRIAGLRIINPGSYAIK